MADVASSTGVPDLNFILVRKELYNIKESCKNAKSVTGTKVT
jgi:hypothetical protein